MMTWTHCPNCDQTWDPDGPGIEAVEIVYQVRPLAVGPDDELRIKHGAFAEREGSYHEPAITSYQCSYCGEALPERMQQAIDHATGDGRWDVVLHPDIPV